jgi:hypothetical protein
MRVVYYLMGRLGQPSLGIGLGTGLWCIRDSYTSHKDRHAADSKGSMMKIPGIK